MKLIIASNNKDKITEIKAILGDRFDEIVSLREAGIDHETVEDGETFLQNAEKKAREIAEISGCCAVADDSGICVDALDGAPGIFSARFCGHHGDDAENNRLLLEKMKNKTDRRAHYTCAIALAFPDGGMITAEDYFFGEIGYEEKEIGYYCSIEHTYDDNTKRITGYIHLYEEPIVKVGQKVKVGQQIGYRGGSPYIGKTKKALYDPHLHLYVTKPISTSVPYSWDNMRKYADDPLKMKYTKLKAEKDTYVFAKEDGCNFGATAEIYEDCLYKESDTEKELAELRKEVADLTNKNTALQQELAKALDKVAKVKEIVL